MPGISPRLAQHLKEVQEAVLVVESLISVIVGAGSMPKYSDLVIGVAESAQSILEDVSRGLDDVQLEKVAA
jgi:hypothetical protein